MQFKKLALEKTYFIIIEKLVNLKYINFWHS